MMKRKLCLWLCVLLLAACLTACGKEASTMPAGSEEPDNSAALQATAGEGETTMVVHGLVATKSLEDLYRESSLVACGEISAVSEPFKIQAVTGGEPRIHTDYTFRISQVLRGEANDTVVVRTAGGTLDGSSQLFPDEPQLVEGGQYLLFLGRTLSGGGYNIGGDAYFVVGFQQGTYEADGDDDYTSQSGQTLSLAKCRAELTEFNKTCPVEADYYDRTELENLKANLESGFITQQEYDDALRQRQHFAQIGE